MWAPTAVALAMTAVAATSVVRNTPATPRTPLRFTIATMGGEEMRGLSISADGRTIVYPATVNGARRAYVRRLDALDATLVPGAEGVFTTSLLPDGRSVVIANSRKQISLVPLAGGAARQLVTSTMPAGMSWSASRGLVLGMPAFSDSLRGLSVVSGAGDTKLTVLTNPRNSMHHQPLVLRDGVTMLYLEIGVKSGPAGHLGIGSLATNTWETTDLLADDIVGYADDILVFRDGPTVKAVRLDLKRRRPVGEPVVIDGVPPGLGVAVMASNGTMVMYAVSARYQLELVNERGEGEAVIHDTLSDVTPRFSPDGKQAALVATFRGDGPTWVVDLGNRTATKLAFTFADGLDWTRDGRTLVAASMRGEMAYVAADGGEGERVRPLRAASDRKIGMVSVTVSPDGKSVVFGSAFGDGFNLMVRHLDGDTTTKALLATSATELAPRFSPDGRWLAYSSDESGRQEVYVQPYPGPGRRVQVSTDGGEQPVWSNDGRLFYREGKKMMVAQLSRASDVASVASRRALFEGDFYGLGAFTATYDVSPDGRHFLMGRRIGSGTGQLIVWVDWLDELKARLDNAARR